MAIDVRIPTILRSYTDGQKAVTGTGDTIAELLADLDAKHPGLRARLITEEGALHRFVNVYINDEDVRFLGSLEAKLADGDTVTILPAVAGGALGLVVAAAVLGVSPQGGSYLGGSLAGASAGSPAGSATPVATG
jgi:molybdopterin synthase sulfur carrier subunit